MEGPRQDPCRGSSCGRPLGAEMRGDSPSRELLVCCLPLSAGTWRGMRAAQLNAPLYSFLVAVKVGDVLVFAVGERLVLV